MTNQKTEPGLPGQQAAKPHLDESVEETTLEIFAFLRKYRVVLIGIALALIVWLVAPGYFESSQQKALESKNARIHAALSSPAEEVSAKAEKLLAELKGDKSEIALAMQYSQWLVHGQGKDKLPAPDEQRAAETKAHGILIDVQSRHPGVALLDEFVVHLKKQIDENASYKLPEPPPPAPVEGPEAPPTESK